MTPRAKHSTTHKNQARFISNPNPMLGVDASLQLAVQDPIQPRSLLVYVQYKFNPDSAWNRRFSIVVVPGPTAF